MATVLALLAVLAVLAAMMVGLMRFARRVRGRAGGGNALMGTIDQVFHPAAMDYHVEVQAQEERLAPRSVAGDRPDDET